MRTAPDAVFKALADPTRRHFERLSRARAHVRADRLLGISQPAVSKHLAS